MTGTPISPIRLTVTRRRVLAGIATGGALVATGGIAACTRTLTSTSNEGIGSGPRPGFGEPPVLTSREGRLEVTLTAAAATVPYGDGTRWALTYNGSTPGPTLRVRPGDLLVVTLDNQLDAPTNLHTHGLHVSPEGDSDNVFVMIDPGERHTYRYQIPADHPSGTFWYHPHHHGNVARQVFGGMAGAIVIEDDLDALPALAGATERVLVLSDPNIGDSAAVLGVNMMQQMNGREGSTILVNGLHQPRLPATTGTLEHWRIINASPSRYYAFRLDGHQLHLIASDGGRLGAPQAMDELVLVPGERAEVLVAVTAAGTHDLTTRTVDRGGMGMGNGGMGNGGMGNDGMGNGGMGGNNNSASTSAASAVVVTLDATGEAKDAPAMPSTLRAVHAIGDEAVSRSREVTLSMSMGMGGGGRDGNFRIDGRSFDPDRVDIDTRLGTTEEWTINNTSTMDHPFHLHVWPFQVVPGTNVASVPTAWKDTVNVPAGRSVRIRIPFKDFGGKTVYHCHILDHEDLGMMGMIDAHAD